MSIKYLVSSILYVEYSMKQQSYTKYQSGQILVITLIVLAFVIINTLLLLSGSLNFSFSSQYTVQSNQAQQLAEAGIDKAVASLNAYPSYSGESETFIGPGS